MKNRKGTVTAFALFSTVIFIIAFLMLVPRLSGFFTGFQTEDSLYNFLLSSIWYIAGFVGLLSFVVYINVANAGGG